MGASQLGAGPIVDDMSVDSLTLINADTGQLIRTLSKTDTVGLNQYPDINIVANTIPTAVGGVVFYVDGSPIKTENAAPYALAGDNGAGGYESWQVTPGVYTIEAVPYSAPSGGGTAGTSLSMTLNVVENAQQTETFLPVDDAYLQGSTRYNNDKLRADLNNDRVSYLKFDLSSIGGGTIRSATLRMRVKDDDGQGQLSVYLGDSNNWTEHDISPSNAPQDVGQAIVTHDTAYGLNEGHDFDVSEAITNGEVVSFIVKKETANGDVAFGSKEADGYIPELVIEYH